METKGKVQVLPVDNVAYDTATLGALSDIQLQEFMVRINEQRNKYQEGTPEYDSYSEAILAVKEEDLRRGH